MPDFFLGIFYSLLPKDYWGSWRPASTVDFVRSALISGIVECGVGLYALWHGFPYFFARRAQEMKEAANANETTQAYFVGILLIEYAFHPLSLLCIGMAMDGAIRTWAALFDEVVPAFPIKLVSVVRQHLKSRQQAKIPALPDLFERLQGQGNDVFICSQSPKEGWRTSTSVAIDGEFYEISRIETATGPRAFRYWLKKLAAGRVVRGGYRYDPPSISPDLEERQER